MNRKKELLQMMAHKPDKIPDPLEAAIFRFGFIALWVIIIGFACLCQKMNDHFSTPQNNKITTLK